VAWASSASADRNSLLPLTPGERVRAEIFGDVWSKTRVFDEIEAGLPTKYLAGFRDQAGSRAQWESVLETLKITARTFERRRREGRLKADEGDRFFRLVHLYSLAADVLESAEDAREWMSSPKTALGNRSPLELARNEAGAQSVEDLLKRIEYGVYG
jgi:putative toxin-antitoxin system antitoxin component (TIGR02293 family)